MTDGAPRGSATEWRHHWPVVLASGAGIALSSTHVYMIGPLTAPLEREFGWSRAEITSGLAIVSALGVCLAPLIGLLIDRYGPRVIGLVGICALCGAIMLLSIASQNIWSWWILWFLLGICALFIKPTIWIAAVSGFFSASRGLALAVTLCGTGIGSTLTTLIAATLADRYGWRTALIGLGSFWLVVTLPIALLFLARSPRRRGDRHPASPMVDRSALPGLGRREGLTSPSFVKLAIAAFLIAIVAVPFAALLVPILGSTGLERGTAASIASMVGIASLVGRLGMGSLVDRTDGRWLAAISVSLPILASGLLLYAPGSIPMASAAAIVLGLSLGAELDLVAYLATRHVGLRNFGLLFGVIAGLLSLATGMGPLIVSHVYDVTGSYTLILWAYMPVCLVSAALFLGLGPYPDFDQQE
ncbi:MAG TPA: MFS transporter [Sphingobium sp.]